MTTKDITVEKEKILCPHCGKEIPKEIKNDILNDYFSRLGKKAGSTTSKKKAASSAKNGKLGGRPIKSTAKPESIKRREYRRNKKAKPE